MILGWHVDSNLAKRLSLRCGPVASLIDHVFCYHCDHTRQATSIHSRDRLQNDPDFFVDEITQPDLAEQRAHWGCADDVIEEIKLSENGIVGYRSMPRSVVAPLDAAFSESRYTPTTYNDYGYDARHALPFLADLLSCYPRGIRLGWCGVRRDMFEVTRQAWRLLGFRGPIAVDAASASRLITGSPDPEQVRILGQSDWLDSADLLAFEFSRASDDEIAANPGARPPELSPRMPTPSPSSGQVFSRR